MHILYTLIDGEVTGGNLVCLELVAEAVARGYEVEINCPGGGPCAKRARETGAEVREVETRRLTAAAVRELAAVMRGVDMAHSHCATHGTLVSRLAACATGTPLVSHAHGRDARSPDSLKRNLVRIARWGTSRACCDAIVAVSDQVKREIAADGAKASKIRVIYNGVSEPDAGPPVSALGEELGLSANSVVVLHVGRLSRTKGQHVLLRAAAPLQAEHPETRILLVGEELERDGRYRDHLEELVTDLELEDTVDFLGYRDDVRALMALADILVLPSTAEGLPLVILEAMMEATPVVATRAGGVPEAVVHGETGLLLEDADPSETAAALCTLLENKPLRERMGRAGRRRARDQFNRDQMVEKVFELYEEVLSPSRGGRRVSGVGGLRRHGGTR